MNNTLLQIFYVVLGFMMYLVAFNVLKDSEHPTRIGTSMFWVILGSLFTFGTLLPGAVAGGLLVILGILTATKQVRVGTLKAPEQSFSKEQSDKLGNKIFVPSVFIAVTILGITQFTDISGTVAIGVAAFVTVIITKLLTKVPTKTVAEDSNRMLQLVGVTCILPQLLASLGSLFTEAGVGDVIASGISVVIPEGNILAGVIAYCLGMALFTMVMGNAFAAFAVITAGIGVPFVFAQGGDIVVASALALTAGYCGTLLTPMAANFNMLPVALLQIKNKNAVIKHQAMVAIPLLVVHIVLMYFLAF